MYYIMPAIFFIGAFILLFVLRNSNKTVSEIPENIQETELTSRFLIGQYVEGLPGQNNPSPLASYAVLLKMILCFTGELMELRLGKYQEIA